ncbi:MAG: ROK family protein [Synergistetes bacterium]|nr:ROK family protein [Synergistota bacterium]MCX8128035.1 ROK family protein [Synergistota bacterium]MDW8193073.1 ROK family protein [Synergistota bacterium]
MKLSIGIDIGGTFIKGGVITEGGEVVDFLKIKTPDSRMVKDVIGVVKSIINNLIAKYEVSSIGVASPGSVSKDGFVLFSPNFPSWRDIPLKQLIEKEIGFSIILDNDANAYAFGEYEIGCAKNVNDFILLTLGTGVGGAIFSGGKLIKGYMGIGGELGHIVVGDEGPVCGCGNIGCLETYSSLSGIFKLLKEEGFEEEYWDSLSLLRLYREGEPIAKRIISKFINYLIKAIISYVHIFNPQLIILGGGLSRDYREILRDLTKKVNERVMPSFRDTFSIVFSSLSDEAGMIGIALMALKANSNSFFL